MRIRYFKISFDLIWLIKYIYWVLESIFEWIRAVFVAFLMSLTYKVLARTGPSLYLQRAYWCSLHVLLFVVKLTLCIVISYRALSFNNIQTFACRPTYSKQLESFIQLGLTLHYPRGLGYLMGGGYKTYPTAKFANISGNTPRILLKFHPYLLSNMLYQMRLVTYRWHVYILRNIDLLIRK